MKLDEIAKLAGVSKTTVSYIVNGKAKAYRVSDKTIQKVQSIVKQHNFQPNAVATSLRVGKTYCIGIIIPDLENTSYMRIANYLEKMAKKEGYQLIISCSEDDPEIEKECVNHLQKRCVDAIVISSSFIDDYIFYKHWNNTHIPIFALDRKLNTTKFRNIVGTDKKDAQNLALEFKQQVKGSTLYIGALPELSVSQMRYEGFKTGYSNQFEFVDYIYAKNYSRLDADIVFSDWLKYNEIPMGIYLTSFSLLQGVIDAILRKFGHLPANLTIATFGDNEWLDFLPCRIISLAQNHKAIAEITLNFILKSMDKKSYCPGVTFIPRQLIYRGRLSRSYSDKEE